jgi:hypothetical protein
MRTLVALLAMLTATVGPLLPAASAQGQVPVLRMQYIVPIDQVISCSSSRDRRNVLRTTGQCEAKLGRAGRPCWWRWLPRGRRRLACNSLNPR